MTDQTNTETTTDLPAPELNENGNTPKAPKAPRAPKAPKLAVQDVVLAGMKLDDEGMGVNPTDLIATGPQDNEVYFALGPKAILERLGQLIPTNNCTSIAWYRNAVKSGKRTLPTLEQAMATWTEGAVPPKAPRKNAAATKVAEAKADDKAYAEAMDEWARQQGINVDAEGGYELSLEQLAAFEAQHTAA